VDRGFGPIGAANKGFRPKFSSALRAERDFCGIGWVLARARGFSPEV